MVESETTFEQREATRQAEVQRKIARNLARHEAYKKYRETRQPRLGETITEQNIYGETVSRTRTGARTVETKIKGSPGYRARQEAKLTGKTVEQVRKERGLEETFKPEIPIKPLPSEVSTGTQPLSPQETGVAKQFIYNIQRGSAEYLANLVLQKKPDQKPKEGVPVAEAIEQVQTAFTEGKITESQRQTIMQDVARQVGEQIPVKGIPTAAKEQALKFLSVASPGYTPEAVVEGLKIGGMITVISTASDVLIASPSGQLKGAGVLLKVGAYGLGVSEGIKFGSEVWKMDDPVVQAGAIVSTFPMLYSAHIGAKLTQPIAESVFKSYRSDILADLDLIKQTQAKSTSVVTGELLTTKSKIPRASRTLEFAGDYPSGMEAPLKGIGETWKPSGGGRAVRGFEMPSKIYQTRTIGGKTVEIISDLKTGSAIVNIFEGTAAKSRRYVFSDGLLKAFEVQSKSGIATTKLLAEYKVPKAVSTVNLIPVETATRTVAKIIKEGQFIEEAGFKGDVLEVGLGTTRGAKSKIRFGAIDLVSDVSITKELKGRPSRVARFMSKAPEIFVAQTTQVRYELPGSGYFRQISQGAIPRGTVPIKTPSSLEIIDSGLIKPSKVVSSGESVLKTKTVMKSPTITIGEPIVSPAEITLPKLEAPKLTKGATPKSAIVLPSLKLDLDSTTETKLRQKLKTKVAVKSKLKTDVMSSVKIETKVKSKVKVSQKAQLKSKSKLRLKASKLKAYAKVKLSVETKIPINVKVPTVPRPGIKTPLDYGRITVPKVAKLGAKRPSRVVKVRKILKGFKRFKMKSDGTFLAVADPISLGKSYRKYGKATPPKQTKKTRLEYRRKVAFKPFSFKFKTQEQRRKPKKKGKYTRGVKI